MNSASVISYGLPASTLSVDGSSIRVYAKLLGRGTTGLRLAFGATNIISNASLANGNKVDVDAVIHRAAVSAQTAHAKFFSSNLSFNLLRTTPAETLTSVVTITLATTSATTADCHHFEVSLVPGV